MDRQQQPDIGALFALLAGAARPLQPSEENPDVDDLEDEDEDGSVEDDDEDEDEDEDEDDSVDDSFSGVVALAAAGDATAADDAADDDIPPLEGARAARPAFTEPPLLAPAEQKLVLTDDPLAALAENDRYRRADVADGPESGLWTVDQWAAAVPRQYKYVVQTLAPRHWPTATPLGQAEYTRRFAAEFPEVASILPIENVYVAGGAAAWPFGESSVKVGDVDLFIAGIEPADRVALWKKAAEVVRKLRRAFMKPGNGDNRRHVAAITETLSPGLVTFTASFTDDQYGGYSDQKDARKVQIILRAFPSVSGILHGFDVPACCVAYDGRRAYLTYLAAWAHAFRVNVVCPAYRSTTYEARLVKYFGRGYALALPHLRRGALAKDAPLQLPHLVLQPTIVRGLFAVGTAALPAGSPAPESDYGPARVRVWSIGEIVDWAPAHINIRQLAAGENRFVAMALVEREPHRRRRRRRPAVDEKRKGLPFAKYATAEPSFAEILPRELFEKTLDAAAKAAVNRRGLVNSVTLRRVFRLSDAELSRFTIAVSEALARNPGRCLDMSPALARFRAALVAAYDAAPADVGWWIVTDPSRQYTVSLNPRIETPALWYGAAYAEEVKAPSSDDFVEALLATLEGRQGSAEDRPVFDGMCPLCRDPLTRGVANSVILPCGHIFHWSETEEGCAGLFSWAVDNHTCPTCRRAFVDVGDEDDEYGSRRRPAAVPVDIEW
jgi:hypothetical protein